MNKQKLERECNIWFTLFIFTFILALGMAVYTDANYARGFQDGQANCTQPEYSGRLIETQITNCTKERVLVWLDENETIGTYVEGCVRE